jgi:asparagine synthetase B (glutamine-hydrolysing)
MGLSILRDLRTQRGRIWNVARVVQRFPFGPPDAPWNRGAKVSDPSWVDAFIYGGYRVHGAPFLRTLRGRFAIAVHDPQLQKIFLARDWIGEVPMHILATATGLFVANTISDLRNAAGTEYAYAYIRAFPQSYSQEIDLRGVDPACVALTMRPERPALYFDFETFVRETEGDAAARDPEEALDQISAYLRASIKKRACDDGSRLPQTVLLSGGLDSFTVALTLRSLDIPFEAFTLSVDGQGDDAAMAVEFARRLGVPHHRIDISPEDVADTFDKAVRVSESYHLFNVYCAVGMLLMGHRLAEHGVRSAFCGEAVNEAVGDYQDWVVRDPRTGEHLVLQHVDHERLERTPERALYVWGHPSDRGKYNRQLGTGLAKHAGARMVKPFYHCGITLECPYYEPPLLARLIAVPPEVLHELGGKPGLMVRAFQTELNQFGIDEDVVLNCKKVRLQDASEGGEGGLTPVLLAAGCDQRRAIEVYNRAFDAGLDPVLDTRRLALTS